MAGHPQPEIYTANDGKQFKYDARDKFDIDGVDAKADGLVTAASEGCDAIVKEINNVQIGQETLSVADSSLEPALQEVAEYIGSIAEGAKGVSATAEEIKGKAAESFTKLQTEENERAKADCEAHNKELAEKEKAKQESS